MGLTFPQAAILFLLLALVTPAEGAWLAGDLHSHTWLTDGSRSMSELAESAFQQYGLDWLANSEHGGAYTRNPEGLYWDDQSLSTIFLGDPIFIGGHQAMWRWQSLRDYSFPLLEALNGTYPDRILFQALEWNVPGHGHASVGIAAGPEAVSDFEYLCDAEDTDTSRNGQFGISVKPNAGHPDALYCVGWLQEYYPQNSYIIINHPSRNMRYSIGHIRELNDYAPEVFIGFEGLPGHQKSTSRGKYNRGPFLNNQGEDVTFKARTYGGADYMAARTGGVWDALLGEGRRFWIFANSDFHNPVGDFWPGEYAKTYLRVVDGSGDHYHSPDEVTVGLRSGSSFVVHGDLIKALRFRVRKGPGRSAGMGRTLEVKRGKSVRVVIKFKSPMHNNNCDPGTGLCDRVRVDHIDLISGRITGLIEPGAPEYESRETNETARVIQRFSRRDWRRINDWKVIRYRMPIRRDRYLRLRGTNLESGTPLETDAGGDPLRDDLMGSNNAQKAYADLWFYSNPIFLRVRD
jgi:hypothetical protein